MCEELLNVPESPHTYHSQEFTTIRPTMLHSTKNTTLEKVDSLQSTLTENMREREREREREFSL